ncbi:MAG: YkgJ family cysteine cluster protein [Myxococcota bacterium]|jgi:Fe-S-cluster containining protein|nr:YkgJ family cysteine cluster protein [Myxococcota bacterium]
MSLPKPSRIVSPRPSQAVVPAHLSAHYFTFPDRALRYDCRQCLACCRGLGIGVDARSGELDRILERYPALASFARLRGSTWTFANPRGACFFLDEQGWCVLEKELGRSSKPAACRLFPVNRVFLAGSLRVVDYNAVICPLRYDPLSPEAISHDELLAEIDAVQDAAVVGSRLMHTDAEQWLMAERERSTSFFEQAAALHAGTEEVDEAALLERFYRLQSGDAAHLPTEALAELFAETPHWPRGQTLALALLATPSLRFNERFAHRGGAVLGAAALAPTWLVWMMLAGQAQRLAGRDFLAIGHLSLQALTSLWMEAVIPGQLLALWEQPMFLPGARLEWACDGALLPALQGFAQNLAENRRAARPLGQLFEPLLELAGYQRVAAVRALEPLLARLQPVPLRPVRSLARRR